MQEINPLIRSFSYHYREKYGQPVGKIPVDNGYPCPNWAKNGCIFCLPASYMPEYLTKDETIELQIQQGKTTFLKQRFNLYFAYYQQGSCTVAPVDELLAQARMLLSESACVGVIYATRPDCISHALLEPLAELVAATGKECHFELGLQSADDKSLALLNRNHTVVDFEQALLKLRQYRQFSVGAHLIFGIPEETRQDMLASVQYVCGQGVDSLKLHHLQVLKNTPLAKLYEHRKFSLFSREEYVDLLLEVLPLIPAHIVIDRLWTHSHPDLVIAPKWNILPGILSDHLYAEMRKRKLSQGCLFQTNF